MVTARSFIFRFDDVEVREREFSLIKAGERLAVEPKAFRVLLILLRNPGKLIPKQELLDAVWGDAAVTENSLARSVALLRKVLGDEARTPRFIETVTTVGYRFLGSVEAVEDPAATPTTGDSSANGPSANAASVAPVRNRPTSRLGIVAVTGVVMLLALVGAWYLSPPLPPPRVTEYTRMTHDGRVGDIAGTDGSRIYFNMSSGRVAQVGVAGGDTVIVPTGSADVYAVDLSGDGTTLLLYASGPSRLLTVGTVGGSPRLLADWHGRCGVAWSPDAKYIAYPDCSGNLFVMRPDGTDNRKLATVKDAIRDIGWSPDGSRIRFTADNVLWEVTSSGANLHKVLPGWKGPDGQCCGRWTPEGDFFLFLAGGNLTMFPYLGGFEQIWVLDERRSHLRRVSRAPSPLTSGPVRWSTPIPSRDGKKLFAVGTTPRGELVRFDAKAKTLQPFLGGISAEFVAYSKDGSQISYVTYPEGELWRAKADGSDRVQLTSPPVRPFVCRWSPDGTQILFSAARSATQYGLYTISTQGGQPRLVLPADYTQGQGDGTWSPDGRRIVYHTEPSFSLHILTVDSGKTSDIPGSDGLYSPHWSPDGRYIVAMTSDNTAIKIFDLQTQQWSTRIERMGEWGYPTWSHDSKFIYAKNDAGPVVYRIPLRVGPPQRVVDLSDVRLIGAVGYWMGLDPSDAPLLLRSNGTTDIYALTLER